MNNLIKNKTHMVIILILSFAGLSFALHYLFANKSEQAIESPASIQENIVLVDSYKLQSEDIMDTIKVSSVTKPLNEVNVSSKITGRIISIHANEGDHISAGQTIVQIEQDPVLLVSYENAQNNLQIAQTNLNNIIDSTNQDIKNAKLSISSNEVALKSVKTAFDNIRQKLEYIF